MKMQTPMAPSYIYQTIGVKAVTTCSRIDKIPSTEGSLKPPQDEEEELNVCNNRNLSSCRLRLTFFPKRICPSFNGK